MKKIRSGLMIILEGGEGVGKTTQAKRLVEYYTSKGYAASYFREPGGNEVAEQIRNIALYNEMDPITETLLMCAARNINVQTNVLPALLDGNIVILDRFTKSTIVYQCLLKDNLKPKDVDFIDECTWNVVEDLYSYDTCQAEITLLCDPEVAMERAKSEGHERNKNDILPIEDYRKINDAYYELFTNPIYKHFKTTDCEYYMINTTNITEDEVFDNLVDVIDRMIEKSEVYGE